MKKILTVFLAMLIMFTSMVNLSYSTVYAEDGLVFYATVDDNGDLLIHGDEEVLTKVARPVKVDKNQTTSNADSEVFGQIHISKDIHFIGLLENRILVEPNGKNQITEDTNYYLNDEGDLVIPREVLSIISMEQTRGGYTYTIRIRYATLNDGVIAEYPVYFGGISSTSTNITLNAEDIVCSAEFTATEDAKIELAGDDILSYINENYDVFGISFNGVMLETEFTNGKFVTKEAAPNGEGSAHLVFGRAGKQYSFSDYLEVTGSYDMPEEYYIWYENVDGALNNNPDSYRGEDVVLTAPVKDGYRFEGWYTDEELTEAIETIPGDTGEDVTVYAKWSLAEYTITYVLDGGTNSEENPATYTMNDSVVFDYPTKEGYDFDGWYTDPNFTDESCVLSLSESTGDIVLYAKWNERTYDVFLRGWDFQVVVPEKYKDKWQVRSGNAFFTVNGHEKEDIVLPDAEPRDYMVGYKFDGWVIEDTDEIVTVIPKDLDHDLNLEATYSLADYKISYVLYGGTNSEENPATYTIEDEVWFEEPTKEGYDFDGWYTTSSFDPDSYVDCLSESTGDIVLYAKWNEQRFKISLLAWGGQVIVPSAYKDKWEVKSGNAYFTVNGREKADIKLPEAKPTKSMEGLKFSGWYNEETGEKVTVISKNHNYDLTLVAHYSPIDYKINYRTNSGVFAKDAEYSKTYNRDLEGEIDLPDNSDITRNGYELAGWYTDIKLTEESYVEDFDVYAAKDVTLYAKWTPCTYTIEIDTKEGTLAAKNFWDERFEGGEEAKSAEYTIESPAFKLPKLEKTGYKFNGFVNTVTGRKVSSIAKGSYGDQHIEASFTPVSYKITYRTNGGTIARKAEYSKTFNIEMDSEEVMLPDDAIISRKGYEFVGWYTDSKLAEESYVGDFNTASGVNVTLYAKWSPITYQATVFPRGGELAARSEWDVRFEEGVTGNAKRAEFTVESPAFKLPKLTCDYYKFNGFVNMLTGKKISSIAKGTAENLMIEANFTPISYSITYTTNKGTIARGSVYTKKYNVEDKEVVLPDETMISRKGFEFAGWYTTNTFDEGTEFVNIESGVGGNIRLYAKWTAK